MKNTMKKALSLLVVFAMVCCPMIASAAAGDGVATPPSENWIDSGAVVTVEAGATTYFEIGTNGTAGTYGFIVEGTGDFDVAVCTEGSGDYAYTEGTPVSATDGKVETEITSYESTYGYAAFSITNNTDAAVDYTVTVVFPVGSQGNPQAVTLTLDATVDVTVPAGAQYYVSAALPAMNTEYDLTVTGATGFGVLSGWGMPTPDTAGSVTATVSASMFSGGTASFSIFNNTESEQTYTLKLANKPAGSSDANPEIITAAGDYTTSFANGHFYQYTATEAGTLTVTMSDAEGWQYQINGVLADESFYYGDMHWSDDSPVVASESVEVAAGDVYTIAIFPYNTANTTVNWNLAFEAAASDEEPAATILIDAVNAASWGEDAVPYGAILVYGTEMTVGEYIGGAWQGWWYKIIASYDAETGIYTVTEKLANDGGQDYASTVLGENEIMILVYAGADGGDAASAATATAIAVGDKLQATGFDFTNASVADMITNEGGVNSSPVYFTVVVEEPTPEPVEDPIISIGATYTPSLDSYWKVDWASASTDLTALTNGNKGTFNFYDADVVAWSTGGWSNPLALSLDLGAKYNVSKIAAYAVTCYDGSGITAPETFTASYSLDGATWTAIEVETVKVATAGGDGWGNAADSVVYTITLAEPVEAQYIQYNFVGGNFAFLSEIEAYGTLVETTPVEKQDGYDEYATPGALTVGTADYDLDDNYVYTLLALEPTETGKYTITVTDGLVGIVSYNGMWVSVAPNDGTITESSIEWECTGVGQAIWVAVTAAADPASITVEYEAATVVTVPEIVYDNTVTPEEFTLDANLEDLNYVDTSDETDDVAVLGEDGYYHLNTADGPILYVCLNDTMLSLVDANGYGQLKYVEYDEDGNAVSKTDYAEAFGEYVACAYTDDAGMMLYPLTADLMVMFQNIGANNGWYGENGFVGGELNDAWMFACYYAEESDVVEGDVNGDGVVDMFDYGIVKSIYFEVEGFTLEAYPLADVNGDGVVDPFDYLIVKTNYFNS